MQYADPDLNWTEWLAANTYADDATKLGALREYIHEVAEDRQGSSFTADWANKKLAKLGITTPVGHGHAYELETSITAQAKRTVYANNRADALAQFKQLITSRMIIDSAEAPYEPKFISGPEDDAVNVVDPDAPTTVDALLVAFRETVLMGLLAGPKYCVMGANQVLDDFGLSEVPSVREYAVERTAGPVKLRTVVNAFDEASALRVADWRWNDGMKGFQAVEVDSADDGSFTVV